MRNSYKIRFIFLLVVHSELLMQCVTPYCCQNGSEVLEDRPSETAEGGEKKISIESRFRVDLSSLL